MRLVILTPDGVGLRNFAGVFLKQFDGAATVFHELPGSLVERIAAGARGPVSWEPLIAPHELPLSFTLRQMLSYAHVYWNDTRAMRYTRTRTLKGSWKTIAANRAARFLGRAAASRGGIRLLESAYFRAVGRFREVAAYQARFRELSPSLILSSSQQSPRVLVPVLAARSLGIPTVAFVASWDNLTSKGRIAAPFDHFLVWSEHMKGELLRYYPGVVAERVHVVGSPQFDPYADASLLWPKEEFFSRIGADPTRPLVCYSGGDADTCPEDPKHVMILMRAVREGAIRGNPQVLLRPSPVDPGTRYLPVREAYPEMLYAQPAWEWPEGGGWTRCVPTLEDLRFLVNLIHHASVNVNLASTMTLDFAVKDKPVVNIAFDASSPPPLRVPLWDLYYQWEHYAPVVRMGAARFARSPKELAKFVSDAVENPGAGREAREGLVNLQLGVPVGCSSAAVLRALKRIAGSVEAKAA